MHVITLCSTNISLLCSLSSIYINVETSTLNYSILRNGPINTPTYTITYIVLNIITRWKEGFIPIVLIKASHRNNCIDFVHLSFSLFYCFLLTFATKRLPWKVTYKNRIKKKHRIYIHFKKYRIRFLDTQLM